MAILGHPGASVFRAACPAEGLKGSFPPDPGKLASRPTSGSAALGPRSGRTRLGATPPTWALSTTPTVSMTRGKPPRLPLRERPRDERPMARFGSSPEYGLPELETDLGLSGEPPARARRVAAHAVQALRRGLSRGFRLGNRLSCATMVHTARLHARGAAPYRQPLDYPASAARSRPREDSRRSSRRFAPYVSALGCAHRPSLTTSTPSLAISSPLETGHFQSGASTHAFPRACRGGRRCAAGGTAPPGRPSGMPRLISPGRGTGGGRR